MKEITLDIPETVDLDKDEISMILASKLYEQGKLSLGQAAEFAGFSKRTFMELLYKYGVSVINHPASDLSADIANA